jgi:hypothetical protein
LRSRVVVGVNASVVLALGLALLVPLALSLLYRDGSWMSFLLPAVAMMGIGTAGVLLTAPVSRGTGYVSRSRQKRLRSG